MSEPSGSARISDGARSARFADMLRDRADRDGFVPFDRFMDVALYGAGVGFYAREDSPFGRAGDYYTAAHASPLFGRTIAERVRAVARAIPHAGEFRVVDVGAGDGTLGEGVIAGIAEDRELASRTEYVLVERSAALALRAFERLSHAGAVAGIPVRAAGSVGADGPFCGVVVANELLDAQPARRLLWDGEEWKELGFRWNGERLVPGTHAPIRPVPPPRLPVHPDPGTTLEVAPAADGVVREVADHLAEGLFLLLDYGMEESELLAAHPSGTLAAIRRHRVETDPATDPGASDLSVFVNFTRLRAVARQAGFREVAFRRQAEALGEWGFERILDRAMATAGSAEAEVRTRLGAKNLLFGFERFAALELSPARSGLASTAAR